MKGTFRNTFSTLGKNLGKTLDTTLQQVTGVYTSGKAHLYKTFAYLEHDLVDSKSTLGALRQSLDTLVAEGKAYHDSIQKHGGYTEAAKRASGNAVEQAEKYAERVNASINAYEKRLDAALKERFYTYGKVDNKKVDAYVADRGKAVKEYGRKFINKLTAAVNGTRKSIIEDYRRNIPAQNELTGKYAGIGTAYTGILTRNDYEGCLAFYNYANRTMPTGRAYRVQILNDIKVSASESLDELKTFYESRKEDDMKAAYKLEFVQKWLGK